MLAAVASDGRALKYATRRLRGDRAFVSQCCAASGWALHFAAKELREDPALRSLSLAHLPRAVASAALSSARRHCHSPREAARILPKPTPEGTEDEEKTEEHWESFASLSLAVRLGEQEIAGPSSLVPPAIDEEEDEEEEDYSFEETGGNRGDESGDIRIVEDMDDVDDGRETLTKAEVSSYASWLLKTAAFDTSR